MKYNMGPNYESNHKVFALETDSDRQLSLHFAMNEARIKGSFKADIKS